jgi:hypothetical protein
MGGFLFGLFQVAAVASMLVISTAVAVAEEISKSRD